MNWVSKAPRQLVSHSRSLQPKAPGLWLVEPSTDRLDACAPTRSLFFFIYPLCTLPIKLPQTPKSVNAQPSKRSARFAGRQIVDVDAAIGALELDGAPRKEAKRSAENCQLRRNEGSDDSGRHR